MDQDTHRARQALRNFKRLLALEPSHTGHLEQLARLSLELDQPKQAARYFVQRAEVLAERDEPGAALGSVHDALDADPHNDRARALLERLQASAPPGEILMPEGRSGALLPVNDALLAADEPLWPSDEIALDDDPPPARDSFLPPTRRDRPPAGGRSDRIAEVAARLSAGLGARRDTPTGRPAALSDAPRGGNELVSDLAEVADELVEGETTRDFTVQRVDEALVGDATDERPAFSDEVQYIKSGDFEIVGGFSEPPRAIDVSADDVLEVRPETGPVPEVAPPAERRADLFGGSTRDLRGSDLPRDEPEPADLDDERFDGDTARHGSSVRVPGVELDLGPSVDTVVDAAFPSVDTAGDHLGPGRSQIVRVAGRAVPVGSVFAELPTPVLERLIAGAVRRTVRIGVPIVRAGDRFEGPLLLVRGRASCETGDDSRRPAKLAPIETGDALGLVELVRGGRWRASARAELECELLALPVRAVDEARSDHPQWEAELRAVARQRLADQLLASSGLFGHMAPEKRAVLARRFAVRMFGSGDVLIESGQPVDGLYLVIAGEVDVERDRAYLATLGEGDFIGVVAALEKVPTHVRAVAATPVEAFYLDAPSLELALQVPEVQTAFRAVVERRRTVLEGGQY